MKNKRLGAVLVALFCVLAVVLGAVWYATRPAVEEGSKTITVEVVHADESVADFTYHTDAEYLSEVLLEEGLIAGSESTYGLYVETVDGETADYNTDGSYWWILVNDEAAETGVDGIVVHDGDAYSFVYTVYTA